MDTILNLIPAGYWPYITGAVTIASGLVLILPAPSGNDKIYLTIYNVLRWFSLNAAFKADRKG